ncbi:putative DNA-directed RNA polymerase III subunit RPC6 [Hypsibius exemplaris]|uniref:DNA-directed RNA polymerase III subunit RPC6 n=1 Tax=Hypsibius exemplaris TaxID=2072580 RepID=A0A1W0WXE5_HYPEX|nr:putative DNA-directed RNA polymerase III subunit RPC6 [Hypsibius exemplaris]
MAASTSTPAGEEKKPTTLNKLDRLETEIEDLCRSMRNDEVSEQELQEHFLDFSPEQLKLVVGRMAKARKIQIKTDEQHRPSIRLRDPMIARKLLAIEDEDEIKTYEAIEAVGSKGIASRIIKYKTKQAVTRVAKTLAALESKQLIKAVKLQKNTQHVKSYILFHLKLDDQAGAHITVFGEGTNFDTQGFDMVSKLCTVFLKNRMKDFIQRKMSSEATASEILENVRQTNTVKVDLVEESIEAVMKMLELNGKVERREHIDPELGPAVRYRLHVSKSDRPEASIPCIGCPVKNLCSLDSPINPVDCPHFDAWVKKVDF